MIKEDGIVAKGCGCWLFLSTLSMIFVFMLYIFSNGSLDVVENISVDNIDARELKPYFPEEIDKNDKLVDGLKKNKNINNIEVNVTSVSKSFYGNSFNVNAIKLASKFSKEIDDPTALDDYIDVVELTFIFNKNTKIIAKYLVIKGKYWASIFQKNDGAFKPWAQLIGLVSIDAQKI